MASTPSAFDGDIYCKATFIEENVTEYPTINIAVVKPAPFIRNSIKFIKPLLPLTVHCVDDSVSIPPISIVDRCFAENRRNN